MHVLSSMHVCEGVFLNPTRALFTYMPPPRFPFRNCPGLTPLTVTLTLINWV